MASSSNTCLNIHYSDSLRNVFFISAAQEIVLYIIIPIAFFCAIFNIAFFLRGKNAAQPPADILLFVSVFGIIRIIGYLATLIYNNIYQPGNNQQVPQSFNSFCIGTGYIIMACELSQFFYNVIFSLYYVIKIRNPLKSWIKQHRQLHIASLVIIVLSTSILYLADLIGVSILGVCSFQIGRNLQYFDFALSTFHLIIMMVTSGFFLKYLKTISKSDIQTKIYFKFYFKYVIIASLVYIFQAISLLIASINCNSEHPDQTLQIFVSICNIIRISTPIMVTFIVFNHPEMNCSVILKSLRNLFKKKEELINEDSLVFYQDLQTTDRQSVLIELNSLKNHSDEGYLAKLKQRNKACLLNTILGCLALQQNYYIDIYKNESRKTMMTMEQRGFSLKLSQLQLQQQIYAWNYSDRLQIQLTDDIVKENEEIFNIKYPAIQIKFISYNQAIFRKFLKLNRINNLYEKILPSKNQHRIASNVQTDGGRSGQFFFFNYDNTMIIKTVSKKELNVLQDRVQAYYQHFFKNNNSIIVKIYGLYTVVNSQTNDQISFMIMGNLLKNIDRKYMIKSYDLKGSTHQRQVLKNEQLRDSQKIKTSKTLKDKDFQMIERMVFISPEDSRFLKQVIQNDTQFLCSQGLIDYSLIIMKINYKQYLIQHPPVSGLKMYKSTRQEGIVYVFGIIDYLQTWNIRKKGQKWYKSLWTNTNSISSQDPKFYSQRFMNNLINKIFQ